MNARQAIRTAEAALEDIDAILARAIVRPDPAKPNKGNIRRAIIGCAGVVLALTATVLFAGV